MVVLVLDSQIADLASGQSYKHFMLANYDTRVILTIKLLILTTIEA